MDEDQPLTSPGKDATSDNTLKPRTILLTAVISGLGGLVVSQSFELVKMYLKDNSLSPDNNIHVVPLEGYSSAVLHNEKTEICELDIARLKAMEANPDILQHLGPTDIFAVKLFAKANHTNINSNQISTDLLQRFKDNKIANCKHDSRLLSANLEIALVVSQPYPYIYERFCDVFYRPDKPTAATVKIGQIDISGERSGWQSIASDSHQGSLVDGKYKVLKESYTTMNSLESSSINIDDLQADLAKGYLIIGLQCRFMKGKDLEAKGVYFRKVSISATSSQ